MAFSFPSSSFSNDPSFTVAVTRDEFYAFHKIDRTLFTRLVFVLNRDTNQSSQVIAFLFLLEQMGYARNLVAYLVSLPDVFVDAVATEIAVCLSILYNQDYSRLFITNNDNDDESVIPLLRRLTGGSLTLRYIHQTRETFFLGLTKNVNDICNRAFDDICVKAERYLKEKLLALEREKVFEKMKKNRLSVQQRTPSLSVKQQTPSLSVQQQSASWLNVQQGNSSRSSVQQGNPIRLSVQQERAPSPPVEQEAVKIATETEGADNEENEEAVVAADDRTVFLTFSKGYPISESEVRAYFTRKFGEVIEAILMQEVEENEQPLYARMVLQMQCASKMEEIVSARNRNKFTIDGKHVWARKYVRKNPSASNSPSSSHV